MCDRWTLAKLTLDSTWPLEIAVLDKALDWRIRSTTSIGPSTTNELRRSRRRLHGLFLGSTTCRVDDSAVF